MVFHLVDLLAVQKADLMAAWTEYHSAARWGKRKAAQME